MTKKPHKLSFLFSLALRLKHLVASVAVYFKGCSGICTIAKINVNLIIGESDFNDSMKIEITQGI